jgi:Tol biopolymer transport system component
MDELPSDVAVPTASARESRLDSWKEIAAYLRRDVSTVQRWEKREGMPVHRHLHDKQGSVYALRTELDAWSQSRKVRVAIDAAGEEQAPEAHSVVAIDPAQTPEQGDSIWPMVAAGAMRVVTRIAGWRRGADASRRNPIGDAEFAPITDFEGAQRAAAISHDGKFVAFLSNRDGPTDVWITQIGAGRFYNLTHGSALDLDNRDLRGLLFSPDDTLVLFWARTSGGSTGGRVGIWSVATLGGEPRPYLDGVSELEWSETGRLVYHTAEPGDPTFVTGPNQQPPGVQIFAGPPGRHAHFPVWSPDEDFIYFVGGIVPNELDLWRIKPAGGAAERVTFHDSRVAHPVFLNRRTLLYLATGTDGSGPWLHALDVETRVAHRIGSGVDRYTSLAVCGHRRRLVATRANAKANLWRAVLSETPASISNAARIRLPTGSARSPRFGAGYLLYVSSTGGGTSDSLWKVADGAAAELWSAPSGAQIVGGPAVTADGGRVAVSVSGVEAGRGGSRLYVMNADGTHSRVVADSLALRGAPVWAPDGRSLLVTAADRSGTPRVHRVSLDGSLPTAILSEYSVDPVWAPDGSFIVYSGPDIGTTFTAKAATPDGRPYRFPNLVLTRGARRIAFLPGRLALVVLKGEVAHKDVWLIDLETGCERPLTNVGHDIVVRDFDISPDGHELVIEQVQEHSDIVRIDLPDR